MGPYRAYAVELILFALLSASILSRVLLPPVVGLANNGDFERLINRVGIEYVVSDYDEKYFRYVTLKFTYERPVAATTGYVTSQRLLVDAAILLNRLGATDGLFDIRSLGAVQATTFLVGILLILVAARPLPAVVRWPLSALVALVFGDVGYVQYFNSFYNDAAGLTFLALTLGCAALFVRADRARPAILAAYFAASALLLSAKLQYFEEGFILAPFGMLLACRLKHAYHRWAFAGVAVALCVGAVWYFSLAPKSGRGMNLYNSVFYGLLKDSPTPEADLMELGLSPTLASLAGTNRFEQDAMIRPNAFRREFYDRIDHRTVIWWYLRHPDRLIALLDRAADRGFELQIAGLGNYTHADAPAQRARRSDASAWSGAKARFPLRSIWALIAWFGANVVAAGFLMVARE